MAAELAEPEKLPRLLSLIPDKKEGNAELGRHSPMEKLAEVKLILGVKRKMPV